VNEPQVLSEPYCVDKSSPDEEVVDARVVFLTHYIPLYQVRVLQSIARRVRDFHVLVSTPIEPNRDFAPDWSGLNVAVQDTWTMRRQWKHRGDGEFSDSLYIHIPYDTTRRLRSLKPDIVMSLELGARSIGAARYCCRFPESKLILCTYMSQRTEQCRGWLRHQVRRQLLKHADAITYNGPSCLEYLKGYNVDDNHLFHLPYAADDRTTYIGPVDRNDAITRHRFLVVGQLSDRKGVMPMLQQMQRYAAEHSHQKLEIIFAGDGPLRNTIANADLPPNLKVDLLGNVPAQELSDQMLRSGAMIAPTLADEWMLVVNEALQAGLPVIGSVHSQAATTLVRDGFNGWQYDPTQSDSLSTALDQYFGCSRTSIAQMREDARSSVANRTPEWAARGAVDAIKYVTRAASSQS
jgi:glycosyltransferase involved in cell wall biosynthesis